MNVHFQQLVHREMHIHHVVSVPSVFGSLAWLPCLGGGAHRAWLLKQRVMYCALCCSVPFGELLICTTRTNHPSKGHISRKNLTSRDKLSLLCLCVCTCVCHGNTVMALSFLCFSLWQRFTCYAKHYGLD